MLRRLLLLWLWLSWTWAAAADPWWVPALGMPKDGDIQNAWRQRQTSLSQELSTGLSVSDLQLRKMHDPRLKDPVQASAVVACLTVQCQDPPTTRYGYCRLSSMGKNWSFGTFQWTNPDQVVQQGPFPVEQPFASAQQRDAYLNKLFAGCIPGFPGQNGLPDWTLVVAAGALGVAAVAAVARRQLKQRQPQKNDPPRYALQLSSDHLQLAPGQSASLHISAWRVDLPGGPIAAPEATISLQPPAGLQVQPQAAQGSLSCQLSLIGQQCPAPLQITALAGPTRTSAQVQISLAPGQVVLSAWIRGQKSQEVLYHQGWDFAEIICYFHRADQPDQPIDPGFPPNFGNSPLQVQPAALELKEFFQHGPGQYTLRVSPLDLEQALGPDLNAGDGLIQVKVQASDPDGKTYADNLTYRVRPQLEIIIQGWPDPKQRFYRNLGLQGLELVADGEDQLQLALACCRSDKPGPREIGLIDLISPQWWDWDWKLQGQAAPDFDWLPPKELEEGGHLLTILTTRPLLDHPQRRQQQLNLHLQVQLSARAPANYINKPLLREHPLQPRYLDLRCWLVPGRRRGSSEAWCLVFLDQDSSQSVSDLSLQLQSQTTGSARLQAEESTQKTTADGSCQFLLNYCGLDWNNLEQALFRLTLKIQSANQKFSDPLELNLDLASNLGRLLQDLQNAQSQLQLTNPCFTSQPFLEGLQLASVAGLTLLHMLPALRGPLWNATIRLSGHDTNRAEDRFYRLFVCSELRNRIGKWLCSRRHYHSGNPDFIETVTSMNGIEFENYRLSAMHAWTAIFLSGADPMDDPRGLDPWWEQQWQDEEYLHPDGLYSNERQRQFLIRWKYWLTASGRGACTVVRALNKYLRLSAAPAVDIVSDLLTRQLEGLELTTGPDYRYDPSLGYRYYQPEEGISESHALFPYLPRQRFLEDWREQHPHG